MTRIIIFLFALPIFAGAEPYPGIPVQIESVSFSTGKNNGYLYLSGEWPYADTCSDKFSYLQGHISNFSLDYKTNLDRYGIKNDNSYHTSKYPIDSDTTITISPCSSALKYYKSENDLSFKVQRRVETMLFLSLEGPSIEIGNSSRITEWEDLEKIDRFSFADVSIAKNTDDFDISNEYVIKFLKKRYPLPEQWDYVEQFAKNCPDPKKSSCYVLVSSVEYRILATVNNATVNILSFYATNEPAD